MNPYTPCMSYKVWVAVGLLIASNVFMTFAWYYHLKIKTWPLITAIAVSWFIAFFEYCLQVPANRIGHVGHGGPLTAAQLKIIQEAITLTVFGIFSVMVLKEKVRINEIIAFGLIMAGVVVGMMGRPSGPGIQPIEQPAQQP